jgi:NAD+ diphosphatase
MRDAEAVTFARGAIDRAAHLRPDPRLAADPRALCLPLWQGRPLVDPGPPPRLAWLPMAAPLFAAAAEAPVFLGVSDDAPRFAREIPDWDGAATGPRPSFDDSRDVHPAAPPGLAFGDLRAVMAELDPAGAGAAAAAKGILGWHATHPFCARCGAASRVAD